MSNVRAEEPANLFSLLFDSVEGEASRSLDQRAIEIYNKAAAELKENGGFLRDYLQDALFAEFKKLDARVQGRKSLGDKIIRWNLNGASADDKEKLILVWATLIKYFPAWKRKRLAMDLGIKVAGDVAEGANLGIVLDMAGQWIKLFANGVFATIGFIADPVIYAFRALVRLLRIAARKMGLAVEEELYGTPKWQTVGDVVSLTLFSLAAVALVGCLISGPVGITVGWFLALSALCITAYFDYVCQERLAEEKYLEAKQFREEMEERYQEELRKEDALRQEEQNFHVRDMRVGGAEDDVENDEDGIPLHYFSANFADDNDVLNFDNSPLAAARVRLEYARFQESIALQEFEKKKYSKRLFLALLIGIAFLVLCGSAAAFAPPAIIPVFLIFAKIASVYLGVVNVGRAINDNFGSKKVQQKEIQIEHPELVAAHRLPHSLSVRHEHGHHEQRPLEIELKSIEKADPSRSPEVHVSEYGMFSHHDHSEHTQGRPTIALLPAKSKGQRSNSSTASDDDDDGDNNKPQLS